MIKSEILDHPFGAAYAKRLGVAAWQGSLPGPKVEEWRFTPLRNLAKIVFVPAATAADVDVTEVSRNVPLIAGAARLVLVAYLLLTLAYPGVKFVTDVLLG